MRQRLGVGSAGFRCLAATIVVIASASASDQSSWTTKWSMNVASRLAVPPVCCDSVVWVSSKGSIQARSLSNGERIFKARSRGVATLVAVGGDSVLAVESYPNGRVRVFGSKPPELLLEIKPRRAVVDVDGCSPFFAFFVLPERISLYAHDRRIPCPFPRASGPGWSDVEVVNSRGEPIVVLSRRSGETMITRGDTLIALPLEFRGGVREAAARGESLLLAGGEGIVALLDDTCGVVWRIDLPAGLQYAPLITETGIWGALRTRTLVRIRHQDGTVDGQWQLPGPLSCPLARYHDGVLWAAYDRSLALVREGAADPVMRLSLPERAVGLCSTARDIIVALEDGTLRCLTPLSQQDSVTAAPG